MSNVTMRYFIGEGARAEQIAAEGMAKAYEVNDRRNAFLAEHGAIGFMERRHRAPSAVIFAEEQGGKKPGFLPPTLVIEAGRRLHSYSPDRRTTIGKEFAKQLGELASFDFSRFAVRAFGVVNMVIGASTASRTGMAGYSSVAGFINNTLVFKIPFGGDAGNGKSRDITIPADLHEIKHSEFIALTEERQEVAA